MIGYDREPPNDEYRVWYDRCVDLVAQLGTAEKQIRLLREAGDEAAAGAVRERWGTLGAELDLAKARLRAAGRWELGVR